MQYQNLTDDLLKEYIQKLEEAGHPEDYIDGVLTGIGWTTEYIGSLCTLALNKKRYIEEEYATRTA